MAQLSVQQIAKTGLNPSLAAANAGGDTFKTNEKTFLVVKNGGASPITVTIDSKTNCDQGYDHDLEVSVPAGEERWIGIFERHRFSGTVAVSYSDVTSVTVGAFSL